MDGESGFFSSQYLSNILLVGRSLNSTPGYPVAGGRVGSTTPSLAALPFSTKVPSILKPATHLSGIPYTRMVGLNRRVCPGIPERVDQFYLVSSKPPQPDGHTGEFTLCN